MPRFTSVGCSRLKVAKLSTSAQGSSGGHGVQEGLFVSVMRASTVVLLVETSVRYTENASKPSAADGKPPVAEPSPEEISAAAFCTAST